MNGLVGCFHCIFTVSAQIMVRDYCITKWKMFFAFDKLLMALWAIFLQFKIFTLIQTLWFAAVWDHITQFAYQIKGATKLYFMYYSRVVISLFSTGLYKSAFSTCSFGKTRFLSFCILGFRLSVSLAFNF